jgi:hypothetical protein
MSQRAIFSGANKKKNKKMSKTKKKNRKEDSPEVDII